VARLNIDYFVLDSLSYDLEDIEHILELLNSPSELGWRNLHPQPFTRDEVVPVLARLIREDLVEACVPDTAQSALVGAGPRVLPDGSWEDIWFQLTSRGRMVIDAWEPPPPDLKAKPSE
jgi:hypothetical protein